MQGIASYFIFGKPLAAELRKKPQYPELVVVGSDPERVHPVDVLLVDVHYQVGQPKHELDDLLTRTRELQGGGLTNRGRTLRREGTSGHHLW